MESQSTSKNLCIRKFRSINVPWPPGSWRLSQSWPQWWAAHQYNRNPLHSSANAYTLAHFKHKLRPWSVYVSAGVDMFSSTCHIYNCCQWQDWWALLECFAQTLIYFSNSGPRSNIRNKWHLQHAFFLFLSLSDEGNWKYSPICPFVCLSCELDNKKGS